MAQTFDLSEFEDAREAFLFESDDGSSYGVAMDKEGAKLPAEHGWKFCRSFPLGVHEPVPVPVDPEPILRGVAASGYFTWRKQRTEPFGTTQ